MKTNTTVFFKHDAFQMKLLTKLFLLNIIGIRPAKSDLDGTCDKNGDCTRESVDVNEVLENASSSAKFVPFRYTSKNRYVDDWEKFITAYGKWQKAILDNPNIKCSGKLITRTINYF